MFDLSKLLTSVTKLWQPVTIVDDRPKTVIILQKGAVFGRRGTPEGSQTLHPLVFCQLRLKRLCCPRPQPQRVVFDRHVTSGVQPPGGWIAPPWVAFMFNIDVRAPRHVCMRTYYRKSCEEKSDARAKTRIISKFLRGCPVPEKIRRISKGLRVP